MRLGLRMGLNSRQGGGSALDADARAYIAAVETALGTPIATALPSATSDPKRILSDFIKAEKATSRWALHKRIYLPIYNNIAASAIDMVSRTSGTFFGTVTHAAGYVQGDGASGFMRSDTSAFLQGRTESTGMDYVLIYSPPTGVAAQWFCGGTSNSFARRCGISSSTTAISSFSNSNATASSVTLTRSNQSGILIGSRIANNNFRTHIRQAGAFTSSAIITTTETVLSPTTKWLAMARAEDSDSVATSFSNAQFGSYGFGLGMTALEAEGFAVNLETLYEGLTGITLP